MAPRKKKKTVQEGNLEYMLGSKKARLRSRDGRFASDPLDKILGKKKKR
jgi:hypothetical protein